MNWRPFVCRVAAALLSAASPAWAGDCWVVDAAHQVQGPRAAQLDRAAALLRRDPALLAIADVRYELHRSAGPARHHDAPPAAEADVWLHAPQVWTGRCGVQPWAGNVYPAGLSVHFNDLGAVLPNAAPPDSNLHAALAPRETGRVGGYAVYDHRLLVITPPGVAAFVPLTARQWLDAWERHLAASAAAMQTELGDLAGADWQAAVAEVARHDPAAAAELRRTLAEARQLASQDDPAGERAALKALRASMSPAALAAPAWVSSAALDRRRFALARPDEPGAQALVQVNPALWRGATPDAVRVVALEVFLNRPEVFDHPLEPVYAAARGWLSHVDPRPYATLLTP